MSEHIRELLSSYIDDEITQAEKELVEGHLESCLECKNELFQLGMIKEQFKSAFQMIEIPDMIEDKVMMEIEQSRVPHSFGLLNSTAILVMAMLAIVLSLASGPVITVGVYIFQTVLSIGRGLIYTIPSLISAVPYAAAAASAFIVIIVAMAIFALRFLVHSVGKPAGAEDL